MMKIVWSMSDAAKDMHLHIKKPTAIRCPVLKLGGGYIYMSSINIWIYR